MQTFLPYADFRASAACLDLGRLGKQRVETLQILLRLLAVPRLDDTTSSGWDRHPAVVMWRGHERALAGYGIACALTWQKLGNRDSTFSKFTALLEGDPEAVTRLLDQEKPDLVAYRIFSWARDPLPETGLPPFLGDEAFHLSHRSNLIRKAPEHYRPFWPDVPDNLPYVWPGASHGR